MFAMRVGIVGLGLIGASIGLALRRSGIVEEVLGHDGLPEHEREALRIGAVHGCAPMDAIAQCDLVFIAVPPDSVLEILAFMETYRSEATIVTDCTSVKVPVAKWGKNRYRRSWFVPGHPMGGTEHSGPGHADPDMFRDKAWILTPPNGGGKTAYTAVEAAVKATGAVPIRFDAGQHDAQIALISCLPHIVAGALLAQADRTGSKLPPGGSWRDATRVGGSSPELWTQIVLSNRNEVLAALSELIKGLSSARTALRRRNGVWLRSFFVRAAETRRKRGGQ